MSATDAEGVQKDLQEYLEAKGINTLFVNMVESLLLAKPQNPIQHIMHYLTSNYPDQCGPRQEGTSPDGREESARHSDIETSDSDEDEDEDEMGEMPMKEFSKPAPKGRRVSVSAESHKKSPKDFNLVKVPKSEEDRQKITDIIKHTLILKGLADKEREILLDAFEPKEYQAGDTIIKQGEDGDFFYVLESGVCEVYKDDNLVQTCTESMSFGELALMYNAPRAATVMVKQNAKVWQLDRQTFKHVVTEHAVERRDMHTGFLKSIEILKSLTDSEREKVADSLKVQVFKPEEVIIKQGDAGNHFYIIEEGEAKCVKVFNNENKELTTLSPGSYFGEISLLTQRPRQATVVASTDVKCLTLDRRTFKRVMGPLEDILKRNMESYNQVMATNI
jgi:cAMP-dependent protein kinase regulator